MEILDDVGHVKSRLVRLEMVLVLVQDRCMVCAKHTIASANVLDAADGTPRSCGSCGISFGPFGDGVTADVRLVHGLR